MSSPRRLAILLLGGSLLITAVFPTIRSSSSMRTVGGQGTDLASHWGSALLLPFEGAALYRTPTAELCAHPAGTWRWKLDELTCAVRGHPELPVFVVNFQQYPRVYPPGCQLLLAPFAVLYLLGAPFELVNTLAILALLVFVHLATAFMARIAWNVENGVARAAGVAFTVLMHLQLVTWALCGIYDAMPLAALAAGVWWLRERRAVAAFVAFSLALFLHYRSLWYLPLFGWAALRVFSSWSTLSRREKWAVAVASCAPALAGVTFLLSWPSLATFPVTNVLRLSPGFAVYLVPAAVLCVLAVSREWWVLSCTAWELFVVAQTREVRLWHLLFAMPLVAVATLGKRKTLAMFAALVMVTWQAEVVFGTHLFSSEQLLNLVTE